MTCFRWFVAATQGTSLLLGAALVMGQGKSQTPAEILFQKAVKDMAAGQYDEACQALDASMQLAPKPGTMYALADCESTRGQTQAALSQYTKYLELFEKMKSPEREKHAERAGVAREAKKRLEGELLFEKAKELRAAGRIDDACSALNQSMLSDPKPGTVYAQADCEATRGRLGTALELYTKYLELYAGMKAPFRDKHGERARLANEQRKKLEIDAPRLKLVWRGQAPEGLEVTREGDTPGPVALGVSLVVNPGLLVFVTRVPGKPPFERKVRIEKGEHKLVELTPGETTVVEENPTIKGAAPPPVAKPAPDGTPGMHAWKKGGIVAMGVGTAAIAAGAVFGIQAMKQKSEVEKSCDARFVCPNGLDTVEQFRFLGNTSTALIIAGAAVAGTGITFFLLAPKEQEGKRTGVELRPVIAPGVGFVGVEGSF